MQRKCLKCGRHNTAANGDELEACPACGAIYSRVAAALAASTESRTTEPSRLGCRASHRSGDVDAHDFAEMLRAESLYTTFRSLASILKFTRREFGTKRFIDISGRPLQRVALYIEAI